MNFDLTTGNARLDGSKMLNQGVGRCGVFHGTERNAGIFHGIYLIIIFIFIIIVSKKVRRIDILFCSHTYKMRSFI